jgi:hypothetical protein
MTKRGPMRSYVAHFGSSVGLIRGRSENDVRDRLRSAGAIGLNAPNDAILVRVATTDDEHLLDVVRTGSAEDRSAWRRGLVKPEAVA